MIRWMVSFLLIVLILAAIVNGTEFSDTRDAKIDRLLKKLNKPAVKFIKSPDGDIIDCVHVKNHPIYDYPLFKNHTIQMRPSSYPKGWNVESSGTRKRNMVTQLCTINGKCPTNSIPIIRTRRKDILQADSIVRYKKRDLNNIYQPKPNNPPSMYQNHEYAEIMVRGKFHGAKAIMNVWKPFVRPTEFSLAQIWVIAGPESVKDTIKAGWQVYPNRYHDDRPRYFIFWSTNGYRTHCYNLDCQGFVTANQEFAIGGAVSNVSSLHGQQHDIPMMIWKDPHTRNWWLKVHDIFVGYWPSSLFNYLRHSADLIQWGGEIINNREGSKHTTTQMGSGRFADEGYSKASYFKNIEIVDEDNIMRQPNWAKETACTWMTHESCYNIKSGLDDHWGMYFFYGGPGRNPNCR